jgi:hypothetical protein
MSEAEFKHAKVEGPRLKLVGTNTSRGQSVVVAGAASAGVDLSASGELGPDFSARMVTLIADAAVWYRWSASGAETVDETQTAAGNAARCSLLPANVPIREYPGGNFLTTKRVGGADVRVRVHTSSP